jgi:peptidoglycan hydrolase-like protein with peptidoglycan-binding domain
MINASVGSGGANRPEDVKVIQRLLGDLEFAATSVSLDVDGIVGPRTIGAITTFQQGNPGLVVDGRIDPGGGTFTTLDLVCANLYATILQEQALAVLVVPTPADASGQQANIFDGVRHDFSALVPTVQAGGASRFHNPVPPFLTEAARVRLSVLGTVEAVPLIIVLIFILALLVVLTSNPIWQRAAKETIKGLKDRMRLLSQKIRDRVQALIDELENIVVNTGCSNACASEMNRVKDIARQINELMDQMPANDNDPEAIKAIQFQLVRLHDELMKAAAAVTDCLARNGC